MNTEPEIHMIVQLDQSMRESHHLLGMSRIWTFSEILYSLYSVWMFILIDSRVVIQSEKRHWVLASKELIRIWVTMF